MWTEQYLTTELDFFMMRAGLLNVADLFVIFEKDMMLVMISVTAGQFVCVFFFKSKALRTL